MKGKLRQEVNEHAMGERKKIQDMGEYVGMSHQPKLDYAIDD